jgi:7,8-dihydroneopterin aldolase/epimerase/oxygenase
MVDGRKRIGRNEVIMGIVFIKALKLKTIIGIYAWERCVKQTVILDLEMHWDIQKASKTDDIQDTLDYKKVAQTIEDYVDHSHFQLIEALAEAIANLVMETFHIEKIKVTVIKPAALSNAESVGVTIERAAKAKN